MRVQMKFVFLVLLAGCSTKNPVAPKPGAASDSLRSPDSTSTVAVASPEVILTYEQRQGKFLYREYCMVCHGEEGKGDGFNAFNLDPRPRDFTDSTYMNALGDQQALATIMGGGRSVNKSPLMPPYGWTLKRDEIRYVVAYVKTLFPQNRHE